MTDLGLIILRLSVPPCDIASNSKHKWQTLSLQNPKDPKFFSCFFFEFNHILLSLSFANITLCMDICKKVNEKAANDCSLAAV